MAARRFIPDLTGSIIADSIKLTRILAYGSTAIVYHGIDISPSSSSSSDSPAEYAVKCMITGKPNSPQLLAQTHEINNHKLVSGQPDIVKIYDTHHKRSLCGAFTFVIMENCGPWDLTQAVLKHRIFWRNDELIKDVFVRLVRAVERCHELGISHRDLKPQNVCVERDGSKVWLADFGMATKKTLSTNFRVGTLPYISPECIGDETGKAPYSPMLNDIWSLGIILATMIAGRRPWREAMSTDESYSSYLSNPHFLYDTLAISHPAQTLLRRILITDPTQRPSLSDIVDAVMNVDTFFKSDQELLDSTEEVKASLSVFGDLIKLDFTAPRLPTLQVVASSSPSSTSSSSGTATSSRSSTSQDTCVEAGVVVAQAEKEVVNAVVDVVAPLASVVEAVVLDVVQAQVQAQAQAAVPAIDLAPPSSPTVPQVKCCC